tara:strand:- start:32 stop:283 length:252 start_codon:yes stop_codon:yes gene_type:complete
MTTLEIIIGVAIALAAFFGKRAISRLDKLDDRGHQTNEILARMDERDSHRTETIKTLRDRTHDHANKLQHHETRLCILEDKEA